MTVTKPPGPSISINRPTELPASLRLRRITTDTSECGTSIWEPVADSTSRSITTSDVIHRQHQSAAVIDAAMEAQLIHALKHPVEPSETHHEAGARRERAVAAVMTQLNEHDAYQLSRRLRQDRSDDPIIVAMRLLLPERRQRLSRLLDAHRRMLAAARARGSV
jgi:hypothetical protein